jgi:hypothetical protein
VWWGNMERVFLEGWMLRKELNMDKALLVIDVINQQSDKYNRCES